MLDHVSVSVSRFAEAERFYDAVMRALGVPKVGRDDDWIGYGDRADSLSPGRSYFALQRGPSAPADKRHWAFKAASRAAVDAFWSEGIAAGGSDDGPPGLRPDYHAHYYGAFLRDPEGNRVEAVCHLAP